MTKGGRGFATAIRLWSPRPFEYDFYQVLVTSKSVTFHLPNGEDMDFEILPMDRTEDPMTRYIIQDFKVVPTNQEVE